MHFLYKRREFITLLGGAAVASPLTAHAEQPAMTIPVVGFLASSSADAPSGPVAAIHLALEQAGYEVGQTVRMEYRYANALRPLINRRQARRSHSFDRRMASARATPTR
jgi:putative ABC transport system substrate-binding protein